MTRKNGLRLVHGTASHTPHPPKRAGRGAGRWGRNERVSAYFSATGLPEPSVMPAQDLRTMAFTLSGMGT